MYERSVAAIIFLTRFCVGIAFALMIASVLIQVIGRTAGSSPVWTEELTRFALLYMVALGVGLSLRTGDLVNVDIVCESLPKPLPFVLRFISALIMLGFSLLLIPEAFKFFSIGAFQKSPAMGMRMDIMHATTIVLLALLGVFALIRVVDMLRGKDKGPHHFEGSIE